jgi:competence protein ComEC
MRLQPVYIWKKTPFLRFLLALVAGILLQWHFQWPVHAAWIVLSAAVILYCVFHFIPFFKKFQLPFLPGMALHFVFIAAGSLLTWYQDVRNEKQWFGNFYESNQSLQLTLEEPPSEKTKSFKANASVNYLLQDEKKTLVKGKIIVYFKKEGTAPQKNAAVQMPEYGSQIIIRKPLQEIKNSGNPGGFDYKRYSLFQGITHQVYLRQEDYTVLPTKNEHWFRKFLFSTREKVLTILRRYIRNEKECGLAEALLIGYKNDLEQSLVQSYTNTGVVHIIAISGLHLGLIYWLLLQVMKPLQKRKYGKWPRLILLLAGLWLFALLAGGQASVIRAAVMFTCLALAENFSKKTSVYNTLAFSAFALLCYNPYWLWDVGFQLSYAAVLSIVTFMRPVYNWLYVRNKILDFIWKINAVTIAAQILTVPIGIYHFHQVPTCFLLTNIVAVPLASIILIGLIFLCAVSVFPAGAVITGKILSWLILCLNTYIERIESISFSLWDGLQISITQAWLLILFAAALSYWLIEKSKTGLKLGMLALLGFVLLRSLSFMEANRQQKIIVYNVPQRQGIDFIKGRKYHFTGDSDLLADDFPRNFHLKPSRILHRAAPGGLPNDYRRKEKCISFSGKKIVLLDSAVTLQKREMKQRVDLLVISRNPKIYISRLSAAFDIRQIVFDGSVPAWKAKHWKKECDSLRIPCFDVNEKGAFVMNLR